jgi:hypothetical protein
MKVDLPNTDQDEFNVERLEEENVQDLREKNVRYGIYIYC